MYLLLAEGGKFVQVSSLAYWASVCQICVVETKSIRPSVHLSLPTLHTGLWGPHSRRHVRLGQTNNRSHIPTPRLSLHIFILWEEWIRSTWKRPSQTRSSVKIYFICWWDTLKKMHWEKIIIVIKYIQRQNPKKDTSIGMDQQFHGSFVVACALNLASTARSSKRHSCSAPLVSVVAASGWLSSGHTGGGHTAATHTRKTHTAWRQLYTHAEASQSAITRATDTTAWSPDSVKSSRALAEGEPEGSVSGGWAWTRVWKREPGKRWSSATHPASSWVPGKRAENKSGPTSSIWPAAPPWPSARKPPLPVHFHAQTQSSQVSAATKRQNVSDLTGSPNPEGLFKLECLQKSSFICSKHTPSCHFQITGSWRETRRKVYFLNFSC